MADYDFTGLSPSDFEALCRDLLERSLDVPLQAFTSGRDRGIDLRHAPVENRDWIVQCKHFVRSGYAKLRSHLKKKELPKIKRLQPERYILATSVGLSPSNVDELFRLLSPFCKSKHDIVGRDDLNALLRSNPTLEQTHFKLWFTSEAVLSRVLNNDVFVQSLLTEEQIKRRLGLYVHTGSFEAARQKLEDERVCILSGVPGVGKTTLAEMLLVEYLADNWEVVAIHQNVTEGQRLFRHDKKAKQVFYYDDFLGQISTGEKLGKNEDRALLQLIRSVARTANKRFILTTREYILAQARAEHEHLARSNIDLYRFVVSCDDYSDVDKARILANHLYFAQVPQDHIAALVEERTYHDIISHRNYNPRIIEWMTNPAETENCRAREYPGVFLARLENPSDLWTHAFENQISESARHLLLALASCGDGVFLSDLEEAFESFFRTRAERYGFATSPSSFRKALDELEGNFIRIVRSSSQLVVSCHNPSILDFLNQRLSLHRGDVLDLLRCAIFFEQVERLFKVFRAGRRPKTADHNQERDAVVVREAIDRTLLARSIRLFESRSRTDSWLRCSVSVWDRLNTCCRIGSNIADADLRKTIREAIDVQVHDCDPQAGDLSDMMAFLGHVEKCRWCKQAMVNRWITEIWEKLLSKGNELEDSLDGLAATATWLVRNQERFDDAQAEQFEDCLSSAVSREVEQRLGEGNPAEVLGGDLDLVEEIADTLQRDFSQEVDWLDEAIAECRQNEDEDSGGGWRAHRPASCSSSIESMFDALLE